MEDRSKVWNVIVLIIVVALGFWFFQYHHGGAEPTLTLKSDTVTLEYYSEFEYMDYVKSATDRYGNDLKNEKYITYTSDKEEDGKYKIVYTLTDKRNRKCTKEMKLKIQKKEYEPIYYTPKENSQGRGKTKDLKEDKVFYLKDYNDEILVTKSKADMYGYTSAQVYSVHEVYDSEGELIGFECVFNQEAEKEK